jgi:CHAD domain-containing protein
MGQPSAGDVVLAYLGKQAERMSCYEPRVSRDQPDAVHKMRVATRRMRTALRTFGRVVERDATRPLAGELKWFAGVLGEARDAEVLLARLGTTIRGLPDELVLGPVLARVTGRLARERAAAHAKVVEAMDGDRYRALRDAVSRLLAGPPLTPLAGKPAADVLPRQVRRADRKARRRHARIDGADDGADLAAALHRTRKAAKQARYAAEAVAPTLGKPAKRYAKRMEDVQDLLGVHQDAAVTRGVLRELGVQAHLAGENGFTFGLLYEREGRNAARVERDLPATWKRASANKRKRWLG